MNLGLLAVLVELLGWHYAVASIIAIEASILSNYALNHRWTWRGGDSGIHTFLNFQLVSLVGMAIQWVVLTLGAGVWHAHYMVAATAGIGVATVWNFGANHWFTFSTKSIEAVRRHRTGWMYVGAAAIQVAAALFFIHAWDGFVFTRTVENFLSSGETPYATAEENPSYVYANAQIPAFAQWYAYPPLAFLLQSLTYGPYHLLGLGNAMLGRLALKLPLIGAALLLPLIAKRLARATGASETSARRIEKILLFNPLLLFVGAAWGQTEVLLGFFVVASLFALARQKAAASAILYGLACVVKIFPLFVYPVLLAHIWGRSGFRAALRHAFIAGGTALVVALPFALAHPRGFWTLVVGMHYERPAGGFSPWMMPEWVVNETMGASARDATSTVLSVFTLTAFGVFLLSHAMRSYRADLDVAAATRRMALTFVAFLLVSKVVHEQYMGLAALLLSVAAFVGPAADTRLAQATRLFVIAATVASLLRGLQIIQLIPPDEARILFGATSPEVVEAIRQALSVTPGLFDFATQALGGGLLAYAVLRFRPVWIAVREAAHDAGRWLQKIPHPVPRWTSRKAFTVVLGAALILIPSAAVGVLFPGAPSPRPIDPAPLGAQTVGAYYEVWWRNPSNDPHERYGNWVYATTTPSSGYYSSRTGLFREAIQEMQRVGIDFALLPINTRDSAAIRAFAYEAELEGFQFTLLYDLRWSTNLADRTGPRSDDLPAPLPMRPSTFDDLRRYFERPAHVLGSEHLLKLNGRPVVFLQGLEAVQYLGTSAEDRDIGGHLADNTDASYLTQLYGSDAWVDHPELLAPRQLGSHPSREALRSLWIQAEREIQCEGWELALAPLRKSTPNLTAIVDGSSASAACFPTSLIAGRFAAWESAREGAAAPAHPAIRFETLHPSYNASLLRLADPRQDAWGDGGLHYSSQWIEHLRSPHVLLYAWNAHQEGAAIERTLEYGTLFTDATQRWTAAAEALQDPAAQSP